MEVWNEPPNFIGPKQRARITPDSGSALTPRSSESGCIVGLAANRFTDSSSM